MVVIKATWKSQIYLKRKAQASAVGNRVYFKLAIFQGNTLVTFELVCPFHNHNYMYFDKLSKSASSNLKNFFYYFSATKVLCQDPHQSTVETCLQFLSQVFTKLDKQDSKACRINSVLVNETPVDL